jgi:hypothetical protein
LYNWKELDIKIKDNINFMRTYYDLLINSWKQYIMFYWLTNSTKTYMNYIKKYIPLVNNEDISQFNDNVSINIIPFIAGWNAIKDEILRVKLLRQWFGKAIDESTANWEKSSEQQVINRKRFGFNTVN